MAEKPYIYDEVLNRKVEGESNLINGITFKEITQTFKNNEFTIDIYNKSLIPTQLILNLETNKGTIYCFYELKLVCDEDNQSYKFCYFGFDSRNTDYIELFGLFDTESFNDYNQFSFDLSKLSTDWGITISSCSVDGIVFGYKLGLFFNETK